MTGHFQVSKHAVSGLSSTMQCAKGLQLLEKTLYNTFCCCKLEGKQWKRKTQWVNKTVILLKQQLFCMGMRNFKSISFQDRSATLWSTQLSNLWFHHMPQLVLWQIHYLPGSHSFPITSLILTVNTLTNSWNKVILQYNPHPHQCHTPAPIFGRVWPHPN